MTDAKITTAERRKLLERLLQAKAKSPDAPAANRAGDAPHPVSVYEEMVWNWFAETADYAAPFFPLYQHRVIRLVGRLDRAALERSFSEIVRRSDVLRSRYWVEDGRLRKKIAPPSPFSLQVIDLRDVPESGRREAALSRAVDLVLQPFDHADGPLVRASLLEVGEQDCFLCYSMSHMVSDGFSNAVLLVDELVSLYNAFSTGQPSPLPEPALQYADFPVCSPELLQQKLSFWKNRLHGATPVRLAADFDRGPVDARWVERSLPGSTIGWLRFLPLAPDLIGAFKAVMQQESVSWFEMMLVPFMMLLRRGSGQDDITVFSARLNRTPAQFSVHGTLVNAVIMRLALPDRPTFRDVLRQGARMVEQANAHQEVPLLIAPNAKGSPDYPPVGMTGIPLIARPELFKINFNYLPHPAPPRFHGLSATIETIVPLIPGSASPWDFVLYVIEADGGLLGYNKLLFTEQTAQRLLNDYVVLFERIVARPDARIDELLTF